MAAKYPVKSTVNAAILESEFRQINDGINYSCYAQRTCDEFIEQLEKLADRRAIAITEVKKIASAFKKHGNDLSTANINTATYIANCRKDFEASASLLSKPHTFIEGANQVIIKTIRAILNGFDMLYIWIISAEPRTAKSKNYKFFIPEPQTALAQKVRLINEEFANLEKGLTS